MSDNECGPEVYVMSFRFCSMVLVIQPNMIPGFLIY